MASLDMGTRGTAQRPTITAVEPLTVECLRCGHARAFTPGPWRSEEAGVCPRCQYVGWAYSSDLSERTRKLFRDLPLERRLRLRTI